MILHTYRIPQALFSNPNAKGLAMEWIDERDQDDQNLVNRALVLQPNEPLAPAFIAYWKRILSDGCAIAAPSRWASLSIDIEARQSEEDDQGFMRAGFRNAQHKRCEGVGHYILRGDAFTCLESPDEDVKTSLRKQQRWLFEQYQALKDAVRAAEVRPLLERINAIRPLRVDAAAAFNWFDLQIGQDSFGRLASDDQALLAGQDTNPADLLRDLLPGGPDAMALLQELSDALIEYTPPTFETICCQITEGVEQGQRALFYDISCPQFPDEGTTVVNDRVHRAATQLVQHMARVQGGFPGVAIRLELQKDGTWQHNMRLLARAA
jgi:hypothetical protein